MPLSVIVPTCGRPVALARCLEGIQAAREQLGPELCDVIVTDDSRDDASRRLVAERFPWVLWTAGPRRGPAANRNHGARSARGAWLVFVDDDCEPGAEWLGAFQCALRAGDVQVLEGRTVCPGAADSPFVERVDNPQGGTFWSCNLAIQRQTFESLGGFDEEFTEAGGEDMEFAWRLRQAGCASRFVPGAWVVHPPRRIGWRKIWWRTFLMRWMLLYRLKTRQSPPLAAGPWRVTGWLAKQQATELARATLHWATRFEVQRWRSRLFYLFWKWATFPLLFPYLVVWEHRFRRRLARGGTALAPSHEPHSGCSAATPGRSAGCLVRSVEALAVQGCNARAEQGAPLQEPRCRNRSERANGRAVSPHPCPFPQPAEVARRAGEGNSRGSMGPRRAKT
jgi:GT2 family glycosyltransferase